MTGTMSGRGLPRQGAASGPPRARCCAPPHPSASPESSPVPRHFFPRAGAIHTDDPSHGKAREPRRIRFDGGPSQVGTSRPVIPADGEGPPRLVRLVPFALEAVPVTNARFAAFVAATGYVTVAERWGWSAVFEGLLPEDVAGTARALTAPWWVRVAGATWRSPEGPGSDLADRLDHPVVHVAWEDARAFSAWIGGRLPSEAEWEHAARGGLADPRFPWGDEEPDDERVRCNIWQGSFPHHNTLRDGWLGTAPADAFAPNNAGLFGMAGNVWDWTADPFRVPSLARAARDRTTAARRAGERVLKGGSFLCHRSSCYRYRIAARMGLPATSSASNVGFRVAFDLPD